MDRKTIGRYEILDELGRGAMGSVIPAARTSGPHAAASPPDSGETIDPPPMKMATAYTRAVAPAPHPDSGLLPTQAPRFDSPLPGTGRPAHAHLNAGNGRRGPAKNGGLSPVFWIVLVAIAVGGYWFFTHMHVQQASATPADDMVSTDAPNLKSAAKVDFNPGALDPKTSGKLSLDLGSLPAALGVTVLLDDKVLWSGQAGDTDSYGGGLLLPQGHHSLRVVVSAGGVQRGSGEVSAYFDQGEHMTMGVKLWPESRSAFDPSSEVIVSLEKNLF